MTIQRVNKGLVCRSTKFRNVEEKLHEGIEKGDRVSVSEALDLLLHKYDQSVTLKEVRTCV